MSSDFRFAWEDAADANNPWSHLRVVSFRGTEAMSTLYTYELMALARDDAPEIDPDALIGARCTLRIATLSEPPFRLVHGIIVEAEELGRVPSGMLHRLVLMPPLARAMYRTRCRIFLEKTTRQIIDAVLSGDPELQRADGAAASAEDSVGESFTPARELYTWRIADSVRIDDVATRPYCVQYNESDCAFVSRLLEEEGLAYHYENGDDVCLLVLSDSDVGRTRLSPFMPLGPDQLGRTVSAMKLGARLRPRKVSLMDYNWKQPAIDMAVAAPAGSSGADLVDHEYPGRYTETPAMGRPLAVAKLDRLGVEASYAVGAGACRALGAGIIFALQHQESRYDGEYLVTKIEVQGEEQGVLPPGHSTVTPLRGVPYAATFECVRRGKNGSVAESRFRPARLTPKPRIQGSQTAFVTAEPNMQGAEIHVGGPKGAEIGCVRVKFHWDQDTARHAKEPTSCWVRVNQVFAGVGEGAVFHPRVGVEAIVDFEEGDPDRPIIVGRVYNGRNRPPGGAKVVSTFKTMSSPATGAFNELTFDDTAGNEQIKMHTPYNWSSHAGNDRSEAVDNNSTSRVGTDRSENTGANRRTMVGGDNSELVAGNESATVGVNQTVTIGGNQTVTVVGHQNETVVTGRTTNITTSDKLTVTGTQDVEVTGAQSTKYGATHKLTVSGTQDVEVTGAQSTKYGATHKLTVGANQTIEVGGEQKIEVTGAQAIKSAASQKIEAPEQKITAGGKQTLKSANLSVNASTAMKVDTPTFQLNGSSIQFNGSEIVLSAGGSAIKISSAGVEVNGAAVKVAGGSVDVTGGIVKIN